MPPLIRLATKKLTVPPAGLIYSDAPPEYIIGVPIVYNEPVFSGGEAAQFSNIPALPAGLNLNTETGVICGTPTAALPQTTFTITASNSAGSTTAQLTITVATAQAGEWLKNTRRS